jgi:hypothetical protein
MARLSSYIPALIFTYLILTLSVQKNMWGPVVLMVQGGLALDATYGFDSQCYNKLNRRMCFFFFFCMSKL